MAYNPALYFPQQYQQPYQYNAPMMQPNTRMVEVMPVDSVESAREYPVPIGATLLMVAKDDSFLAIKINGVNGQSSFEVYDKRPKAPEAPAFDPAVYVTKDELESRLSAILKAQKKEGADE